MQRITHGRTRLVALVLVTTASCVLIPPALAQPTASSATVARKVPHIPVYFEPLPDGSFIARHLANPILLTGSAIEIANPDRAEPVRIEFVGATHKPIIEGVDQQAGRVNYLIGGRNSWRTGIQTFASTRTSTGFFSTQP